MVLFLQNMYPQTESDADITVVGLGPKSVALVCNEHRDKTEHCKAVYCGEEH